MAIWRLFLSTQQPHVRWKAGSSISSAALPLSRDRHSKQRCMLGRAAHRSLSLVVQHHTLDSVKFSLHTRFNCRFMATNGTLAPPPELPFVETAVYQVPFQCSPQFPTEADLLAELSQHDGIFKSAALLQRGQCVAFPTETVYGLGANALDDDAVAGIYTAKGRPSDNPLIVHIADASQLDELADVGAVGPNAKILAAKFWPGPLSLIVSARPNLISARVRAGLSSVAIRMPSHPVARALIRAAGLPLAAPSANLSGRPSPTCAQHVVDDLRGRIPAIVDGGPAGVGVESTVVSCVDDARPTILRPGGISQQQLESALGGHVRVFLDEHLEQQMNLVDSASVASSVAIENKLAAVAPAAPGMKYTHYAPKAPLRLVQGDDSCMLALIHQARARGLRVGVLTTADSTLIPQLSTIDDILTIKCGHRSDLESVAAKLYDALREFDDAVPAVQLILSECFPAHNDDIGMAIMNRLAKAAAHRVLCSTDVESNTWLAQL